MNTGDVVKLIKTDPASDMVVGSTGIVLYHDAHPLGDEMGEPVIVKFILRNPDISLEQVILKECLEIIPTTSIISCMRRT